MTSPRHTSELFAGVNLLPAEYRRDAIARGSLGRRAVLLIVALSIMAPMVISAANERASLIGQAADARDAVDAAQQIADRVPALRRRYDARVREALLIERHDPAITYSQIAAALAQVCPPSITLRSLDLTTVTPSGDTPDTEPAAYRRPSHVEVSLTFIAPDTEHARTLANALTGHAVFESIRVDRPTTVNVAGVRAVESRVRALVPLDRIYEHTDAGPPTELTHGAP